MNAAFSSFKKCLLVAVLVFCFYGAQAQGNYNAISFRIDSFANIGLPKSALTEVEKLDELARKNKNAPQQIRATIYRMTFQSYLEEDALNAIIARLKTDIGGAVYPVKPVLQSLLAETYWKYYEENRWKFNQRTRLLKPDTDITKWDLQTVINATSRLYELSLSDAAKEQQTPVGVLDGVLEGDSTTRYLRPTLYDLLAQRAFDFFLGDEASINRSRLPFSVNDPRFFSDSRTFGGLTVKTADTASIAFKAIKYLQQATLFHLEQPNEEALADLDMQRLKFVYDKSAAEHKDSLYLVALSHVEKTFASKPVSSEATVLEGQFYQKKDSLVTAYNLLKKAVNAWPNSLGGKNAAILIKQLQEKELSAAVENVNMPNKPILALLKYRNIKKAIISVYCLTNEQAKKLTTDQNGYEESFIEPSNAIKLLKSMEPVQRQALTLPGISDLRQHSAEFKIAPLGIGTYVMLVKDASSNALELKGLSIFMVTHLAYSSRVIPGGQTEIRVMDRETGAPLDSVHVDLYKFESDKHNKWTRVKVAGRVSDANGKCLFKVSDRQQYIVVCTKGSDTYKDNQNNFYGLVQTNVYNNSRAETILFTDRQLYRPGQTIYFKALQITVDNGKSTILPQTPITVTLKDNNYKAVKSLDLQTNEFGSAQGSFVIPENITNGEVHLITENGQIGISVEEYKRPTFQAVFLPVTQNFRVNDIVKLKGKVTAFSGYGLSNARVAYHITRERRQRFYNYMLFNNVALWGETQEIKTDTINTSAQGEFEIDFKAMPDSIGIANDVYNYTIGADVTDESGETQTASTMVKVGNNPVEIIASVPPKIMSADSVSSPIRLNNLNGQLEKGEIRVSIIALKSPGRVSKNRLWDNPDEFIMGKNEFETSFPGYAWKKEDDPPNWQTLDTVAALRIQTNDTAASSLDLSALKKQPGGIYKIVFKGKDEKGDTTSFTQYITLVSEAQKPEKMDDWLVPLATTVKPGENARFLVGINRPAKVLMETYDGQTLVQSAWINLNGGNQRVIDVPVPAGNKGSLRVQFLMVNDNRIYHDYQRVNIIETQKKLNIKLLTFRDKLHPGENEQWKIQITADRGEQIPAELLAGLYDASLDDIAPKQFWPANFHEGRYFPDYFMWANDEFVKSEETEAFGVNREYEDILERHYEQLNMFGYDYYGGDNSAYQDFLDGADDRLKTASANKKIADRYFKNAALIPRGYDVSGRVISKSYGWAISGVRITIKGTGISTLSNSLGYFRIKVPLNSILIFKKARSLTKEIKAKPGNALTVMLVERDNRLKVADPGQKSMAGDKNAVVVVDEPVGNADVKNTMFVAPVVKADAKVLSAPSFHRTLEKKAEELTFKSQYSNMASTFEKRIDPSVVIGTVVPLRTNFNETAFFYPQLHTDENGQILIDFTIPEALTRWRFRALAHTKDLATGYIEREIVTQKELSISANTPRFLREGDTITISARLANLTAGALKGKVQLRLFNAVNMQPVKLLVNAGDAAQDFDVAGNTNKAISFKLAIPAGLDALDYKLTADAGTFSDGEENTLPVLPNRMLVTESMPMMVRPGQTRDFTFDKLVNQNSKTLKNKTLTLEYTANPAWYAVQAVPYMMEFPYECSEQIFSRYFANSLATNIVTKMPAIKKVFDQWKAANSTELLSNLEKNQELKSTLIEETPWLRDAENETEQKKRIALLFDLNHMSNELQLNLDKLQKRQLPGGGFTWFGGEYPDRYITQHIAEGMGELLHLGIGKDNAEFGQIASNAIGYLDDQLSVDEKARKKQKQADWFYGDLEIHAWFTRSFFLDKPLGKPLEAARDGYLKWAEEAWKFRNVYEQGMIALTMQRYSKPGVTAQIERSLLETAQQSDDMGMYWAKNQLGYFWYESPIETQSLLIDLFTEAGDNAKAVEEMKIWLLRNKQTNDWKTTKATAAACYALLLKGGNLLADSGSTKIRLGGKALEELKPDVKADAGTGYLKTSWLDEQVKPSLGNVEIANHGSTIGWGALHWQYLENLDKITSAQTNIHLERKYFIQKQTDAGPVLTAVDATHQPKIGDLLKVVVYLTADRDFEYVQLKDMRPAGTEPVDALSTYKYQDGLYYYQVTKDVATNFFISELNKGSYVFEYRLRVVQAGDFSTGITSVQCMYAPEFNAHSLERRLEIRD